MITISRIIVIIIIIIVFIIYWYLLEAFICRKTFHDDTINETLEYKQLYTLFMLHSTLARTLGLMG